MNDVVVAVDGSEDSRAALRFGALLANTFGVGLRAVQCWEYSSGVPLPTSNAPTPPAETVDADLHERLSAFVGESVPGDVSTTIAVRRGPPVHVLLNEARPDRASLLVVGSRGLGGFTGLVLGSVSRQLLEHAAVPVAVVRSGSKLPGRLERIAVALDGSEGSEVACTWAGDLAAAANADALGFHAFTPPQAELPPDLAEEMRAEATKDLQRWVTPLERADATCVTRLVEDEPRRALADLLGVEDFDLVVAGARGNGRIASMLLGSVAESLVRSSPVPVVIVPHGRQDIPD